MSWDVILFNSKQLIDSPETVTEDLLVPVCFDKLIEEHFRTVKGNENHKKVEGNGYTICYYELKEPVSNTILNLYGEGAIFALSDFAKKYGFQIFDTGLGKMVNLDHPEFNGFEDFERYKDGMDNGTNFID